MKSIFNLLKQQYQRPKALQWYITVPLPIFSILAIVVVLIVAPRLIENLVKANAVETAVDMTQTLQKIRNYYADNVLSEVGDHTGVEITHLHKYTDNAIPIPATFLMEMAQSYSAEDKLRVNVTSPYPFYSRKDRNMDEFQQSAWQKLTKNPDQPVSIFDEVEGHRVVKVAIPDKFTSNACVDCHNLHQDSSRRDWQLGDVRGIIEITVDAELSLERAHRLSLMMIIASFVSLLVLVLFNRHLAKKVVTPLSSITAAMTALSERKIVSTETSHSGYKEVNELGSAFLNFQRSEQKRQILESEVRQLAFFDPLTNLPNRSSALTRLSELASREGNLTLLIVKIDKFNEINDTLGYHVGDKLLIEVANRITTLCSDDYVARFNTTEFSIISSKNSSAKQSSASQSENALQTEALSKHLLACLQTPFAIDDHQVHVSISIAVKHVKDNQQVNEIIAHGNIALHQAETSHTHKIVTYTPELSDALDQRVTMIKELKQAIGKNELVPYFQPQFELSSGELVGAEVLLRWIKADGTLISPFFFIPAAETSGLIVPIGNKVLEQACRLNKQWQDQGFKPFRIAVNVSGVQFEQETIVREVDEALQASGLDPKWLELEVTETALMADISEIITKLSQLRDLGIELAIDDFGTGYSSLSYLKRLPINRLKIDQSFVRNVIENEDDQAIIEMILNLGKSMKLKVLAEGVEDVAEEAFLTQMNCDEAQGYYYAKPMPADEFEVYLEKINRH
ncbi:EAL domain-containing protein [Thalassotalea euphylliae]|uniref:cyclic-guanylate-specific phosphodiesterase n=1 Tax=Thalassotalea euphylliae TaxID=1655234 RepID=A0A3E0TRR0_9GAMM|nr:EAL domain-containing protein [Thalassotalea euphylliae]REL27198.1 EAL domain-containing protein [Thalassotalea euphylliae]